jgi:NAD(P)-dependent dehydrogenase (short-subunit alcohol dehydrogenase family)
MAGRVCLITGATAGIGRVTAYRLAERGATVVVAGRNLDKCRATVAEIRQATGNAQVNFLVADLASQRAVHGLAAEFAERYSRLDVLINNAGALFMSRQESPDGIEMTFALNHLSYFLLTHLLMEPLRAATAARIINVASANHQNAKLDFNDLESHHRYSGFAVYGRSKLANLLFTYELARRLDGSGITANALHPGLVATNFATNNGWLTRFITRVLLHRVALTPEEGARTSIYLATSPEVAHVSGCYFVQEQPAASSPGSHDGTAARKLWQISEQMTGISSPEFGLSPAEAQFALG